MSLPVIPTDNNGTTYIAVIFVFLAYGLHPTIEKAFERLRAYRAWQNIENGESIEVTKVSTIADTMRGRGSWDAARAIAILLGVFSVASWALELKLDLVDVTDGPVDMMDRPPPVVLRSGSSGSWEVQDDLDIHGSDEGFLDNFQGTLEEGSAKTRFRVGSVEYRGSTLAAWWSNDYSAAHSALNYDIYGNGTAVLDSLNCTQQQSDGAIYVGADTEERWGTVTECGSGPATASSTGGVSAPTIVLTSDNTDKNYLVVEEESNYPGFMYSVWISEDEITAAAAAASNDVTIKHAFHVASKSRMVEAIVTGIVNGLATGGGCVDLLFQYSELNTVYVLQDGKIRASPFGEHPGHTSSVQNLSDVEPIERGVYMDKLASVCVIFVLIVSVLGVGWATCVHSRIGVDIYDRDELIKVASLQLQGQSQSAAKDGQNSPPPSAMRIFVRKDASGKLEITVQHAAERASSCCGSSPTLAAAERGEVGIVHDTGGGGRMRLAGVPLEASPTNTSFLSSQGPVNSTFAVARTTSSRPPKRGRAALKQKPNPKENNKSRSAARRDASFIAVRDLYQRQESVQAAAPRTRVSQARNKSTYKPKLEESSRPLPRPVRTPSSTIPTSAGAKTSGACKPVPSRVARAQASKQYSRKRSFAPSESRAQHASTTQASQRRAEGLQASQRGAYRWPILRKATAVLDKEAALGATFGRPPVATVAAEDSAESLK